MLLKAYTKDWSNEQTAVSLTAELHSVTKVTSVMCGEDVGTLPKHAHCVEESDEMDRCPGYHNPCLPCLWYNDKHVFVIYLDGLG